MKVVGGIHRGREKAPGPGRGAGLRGRVCFRAEETVRITLAPCCVLSLGPTRASAVVGWHCSYISKFPYAAPTLEIPLDSKKVKPVNPKEINPEYSLEGTDPKAEAPILWPPDMES